MLRYGAGKMTSFGAGFCVWKAALRRNFDKFGGGLRVGGNLEVNVREGCTRSTVTQIIF